MNVSAIPGRRDDIISIFVKTPYPKDSADIANAIVDQYREFHLKANKSTAAETRDLLTKAKKETDDQLEKMYQKRQEFQQNHSQYSLGQDRTNAIIERLNQLSSARTSPPFASRNSKVGSAILPAIFRDGPIARTMTFCDA